MNAVAYIRHAFGELLRRVRLALTVLTHGQRERRGETVEVPLEELRHTTEMAFLGVGLDEYWASYATSDELRCLANCVHFAQILRERDWQAVEAMRRAPPTLNTRHDDRKPTAPLTGATDRGEE